LEHQHEYDECNRRDESSKECTRQDNIDETKAKETQDEGNQSNLELRERIEEGFLHIRACTVSAVVTAKPMASGFGGMV